MSFAKGFAVSPLTASSIQNFAADVIAIASTIGGGGGGLLQVETDGTNITGNGQIGNPVTLNQTVNILDLSASYVDFKPLAPAPALKAGRTYYDSASGDLTFNTDVQNFLLRIGQQEIIKVVNNTGALISKGKIVYVSGSAGSSNNLYVYTASWEGDLTSARTIGLTAHDIGIGATGIVVMRGIVEGLNTSAYQSGQTLYLSSSGDYTTVRPVAPKHEVRVGNIGRAQHTNGSIFVYIQNGYELDELHDVLIQTASAGDLFVRSSDNLWKNTKQLTGSYVITGSLNALNGITGSITGSQARFTAITGSLAGTASFANNHANLGGGSLHVTASQSINGFMSSTDKTKLDSMSVSPAPYDISGYQAGTIIPYEVIGRFIAARDFQISDPAGWKFRALTAPSGGDAVFRVEVAGTDIAEITFPDGDTTGAAVSFGPSFPYTVPDNSNIRIYEVFGTPNNIAGVYYNILSNVTINLTPTPFDIAFYTAGIIGTNQVVGQYSVARAVTLNIGQSAAKASILPSSIATFGIYINASPTATATFNIDIFGNPIFPSTSISLGVGDYFYIREEIGNSYGVGDLAITLKGNT